jgi:RNA recognition motif-containing protein
LRVELARERVQRPPNNHASTLFCGNLPYSVTSQDLQGCFEQYGEVVRATVVMDRQTGHSRGFAFVVMAEAAEAEQAARELQGADWGGRVLTVCVSTDRRENCGGSPAAAF